MKLPSRVLPLWIERWFLAASFVSGIVAFVVLAKMPPHGVTADGKPLPGAAGAPFLLGTAIAALLAALFALTFFFARFWRKYAEASLLKKKLGAAADNLRAEFAPLPGEK